MIQTLDSRYDGVVHVDVVVVCSSSSFQKRQTQCQFLTFGNKTTFSSLTARE